MSAFSDDDIKTYQASLTKLLQDEHRKDKILASIYEEVDNLMGPGILECVPEHTIAQAHRRDVIRLWLFHKPKYDSKGTFIKDKCRIVTLSQARDTTGIGFTYLPTVNPISFFVVMGLVATFPNYQLAAYDIKGAFLNSKISDDTYLYVKADRDLAKWFVLRYPDLKPLLTTDHSLTFRLKRYLYGLQESPLAWNKTLNDKLHLLGFDRSHADLCLYTRKGSHGTTYLTVHVDDMMMAFPNPENRKWFETA
jgi:hypothetical protein